MPRKKKASQLPEPKSNIFRYNFVVSQFHISIKFHISNTASNRNESDKQCCCNYWMEKIHFVWWGSPSSGKILYFIGQHTEVVLYPSTKFGVKTWIGRYSWSSLAGADIWFWKSKNAFDNFYEVRSAVQFRWRLGKKKGLHFTEVSFWCISWKHQVK